MWACACACVRLCARLARWCLFCICACFFFGFEQLAHPESLLTFFLGGGSPAGFADESALLKHECAYCLGQMQDTGAIPHLNAVLEDEEQDVMVRHEAAEALGAIGEADSLDILTKYAAAPQPEIAETCQVRPCPLLRLKGLCMVRW